MEPILPDKQDGAAAREPSPVPAQLSGKGLARRRLGMGASGVILTLASKQGMGATYCGLVSGWQSGSTSSRNQTSAASCGGRSHGYYKNEMHTWPTGLKRTDNFSSIFPQGAGSFYTDGTCGDLVASNDNSLDKWNLRCEFVCAYLNALAGLNPHPNTDELKKIWLNYYMNNGKYVFASTGNWIGGEDLKRYLASTHEL